MTTPDRAVPRQLGTAVHSRHDRTVTVYDQHGTVVTTHETGDHSSLDDHLGTAIRIARWQPIPTGRIAAVELP
jgi:hypothetical protein